MKRLAALLCLLAGIAQAEQNVYVSGGIYAHVAAMHDSIILCGELGGVSDAFYAGPGAPNFFGAHTVLTRAGAGCDALGDTTEATADAPISLLFPEFRVHGFYCEISADPTAAVVLTARSTAADLSGSFTCTIPAAGTSQSCWTTNTTISTVAAAATIAIQSLSTQDLSAEDVWCRLFFSIP